MLSRIDKKTQIPLPDPQEAAKIEKANKEIEIKKKRLTLIILLCGTIGLSLSFTIYRNFKTNPPKFEFPVIKFTKSGGSLVPSSDLKKALNTNQNISTFYIKVSNPDLEYFYGQTPLDIPSLEKIPSRLTTQLDTPLPEGLVYKEFSTPESITVSLSVHARNFLIHLKSSDSNLVKPDLQKLLSLAYWSVFGN